MRRIVFLIIIFLPIISINDVFGQVKLDSTNNNIHKTNEIDFALADKDALSNATKIQVMEALFAQIPGLNVTQGNGFSYERNPIFTLQGFRPLILVDGIPRDIDNIIIDEVESIMVYKDAIASALYGVRGARGVVDIISKKGEKSKNIQMEASYKLGR